MKALRQGQFDCLFRQSNGFKIFEIESVNRSHTSLGCAFKQKGILNRAYLYFGSGRLSQKGGIFASNQADSFKMLQNILLDA
jgi:hypothetical protein